MTWSNGRSLLSPKYSAQVVAAVYDKERMEINHECVFPRGTTSLKCE